jgi:hypothetical protein
MCRTDAVAGRAPTFWIIRPRIIRRAIRDCRARIDGGRNLKCVGVAHELTYATPQSKTMAGAVVLLLALVFGLAAVSKMRARVEFVAVLRGLLPAWLAPPVSILIPAGELILAALLLSGIALRGALVAAVIALSLFTVVLLQMSRHGLKGCGCFGESSGEPNTISGVVRNLLLIGAGVWVLWQKSAVSIVGPDVSSFLGRITVVIGFLCLWPCLVAVAGVFKRFPQVQ